MGRFGCPLAQYSVTRSVRVTNQTHGVVAAAFDANLPLSCREHCVDDPIGSRRSRDPLLSSPTGVIAGADRVRPPVRAEPLARTQPFLQELK